MELNISIVKGAVCLQCPTAIQMEHCKIHFICPNCKTKRKSTDAVYEGLMDYKILYGEWITNAEFRAFFNIRSQQTVLKIINRLNMAAKGKGRAKKYRIP